MSLTESAAPRVPLAAIRAYWRPETGIFLGLWFFLMLVGRSKLFQDPGTFWHTIVGERLLSSRHLIYVDTFSFTFAGRPWIPHQWLGECLMAILHRIDGLDTLLLATATILAGLYAWVAQRLIRAGLHWSLAGLFVVIVLAASASHFHIRPHIATIVGLGITVGFITDLEAGRIGMARLAWLIPIYWVWSNIHGGTLGGLATLGLALAGWCTYRLVGRASPIENRRQFFGGCLIWGVCFLVVFINPYGPLLFQTWLAIMDSETLTKIILEHRPLSLASADGWLVVPVMAIYMAALASIYPRWPRVSWLLPLVWLYLACTRVRHAPLFAVTAALALADLLPYTRPAIWLAQTGSDLFQPPPPQRTRFDWRPALLPMVVVGISLVLQAVRVEVPILGHHWARLDPSYWPTELLDDLRKENPDATPIFNDYPFGGFLIYHTPGYRVFVDDRCELYRDPADQYRDQWLDEYVHAETTETAEKIHSYEQRYGPFNFALVQTRTPGVDRGFDDYFRTSPEWKVIRRTATATFYRRKTGE